MTGLPVQIKPPEHDIFYLLYYKCGAFSIAKRKKCACASGWYVVDQLVDSIRFECYNINHDYAMKRKSADEKRFYSPEADFSVISADKAVEEQKWN